MSCSKPVTIVSFDEDNPNIDVKAINSILDKVGDRHFAIYSINGPLRSGKSFMLNYFARYLQCEGREGWINSDANVNFKISGSAERETIGIQIYPEPFIIKKNGEEIAVLLMDTQGIFDTRTQMNENTVFFAISTLLSSFLIFNVKEMISEDMIDHLRTFTGYAQLADEENINQPFQKLLFLVRDFSFEGYQFGYYDDNYSAGEKNYKKDYLDPHEESPQEIKFVHEKLLETYSNIGVYLMPFPGKNITGKSDVKLELAEEDFQMYVKELVEIIFNPSSIVLKQICGRNMTGEEFKLHVRKWMTVFNNKGLPEAKTNYEMNAEIQSKTAVEVAFELYNKKMKGAIDGSDGMEMNELLKAHDSILTESIAAFRKCKQMDKKLMRICEEKLLQDIATEFGYLESINTQKLLMKQIKSEMGSLLSAFQTEIDTKLDNLTVDNLIERELMIAAFNQKSKEFDLNMAAHEEKQRQISLKIAQLQKDFNRQLDQMEKDRKGCSIL